VVVTESIHIKDTMASSGALSVKVALLFEGLDTLPLPTGTQVIISTHSSIISSNRRIAICSQEQ
jgi:hypothetical protein